MKCPEQTKQYCQQKSNEHMVGYHVLYLNGTYLVKRHDELFREGQPRKLSGQIVYSTLPKVEA